ncbi:DUF5050 domain-containing protein [Bacillus sp. FJAT-29790]|uniref:DUF5050 domain-containing protein n=1 Tax=Bacillus sp. FJAT-29790 TaxID=1895002 RepID=UPI001C23B2BE|nr:DUF5050 domain-containing protein [Bacillus sp. FJAT-29790]MBU8881119.1 DUF5050 domain-containing protein [Bacillus sp. FJAT-29790]
MKRIISFLLLMCLLSFNFTIAEAQNIIFKDVPMDFWAYKEVGWAQENSLVKGYSDGTFKPNNTLTEAQLLAITIRYFHLEEESVTQSAHWADGLYQTAEKYNLPLNGFESIKSRDKPVTRGLLAQMLAKTQGRNIDLADAVNWMFEKGITTGRSNNKTSKLEQYDPSGTMTRAQTAVFFKRLSDLEINSFILQENQDNGTTFQERKFGNLNSTRVEDRDYVYSLEYLDTPSLISCIYRMNKDGSSKKEISCGYYMKLAIDGDYIYSVRFVPSFSLVRMNKDGSNPKELNLKVEQKGNNTRIYTDETFLNLVVDNGWIYYVEEDKSLWKFTTDYKNKTKLKSNVEGFSINKGIIYYTDNQSYLYKMKIDGTLNEKVSNEKVNSFFVNGDWIYFVPKISGNPGIKKIKVNGGSVASVISVENAWAESFIIYDNWIYFTMTTTDEEGALYKLSKNTANITDLNEAEKIDNGYCYNLQIFGNQLWYTKNGASLYRMDSEGKQTSLIGSGYKTIVGTDASNIFFIDTKNQRFGAGALYKASLDGSNKVLLANNVSQASISDKDLYYTEEFGSFFKMSKDGNNKKSILYNGVNNFLISEDTIVYKDSYNANGQYDLLIINPNKSERTLLAEDCSELLTINNGWIYYLSDETLVRIKFDGTSKEVLAKNSKDSIFISGNDLYYVSSENDHFIYKKELNTNSTSQKITTYDPKNPKKEVRTNATSIIKIDSNYIYYVDFYSSIKKVPVKGGAIQELATDVFIPFPTTSNWIYFTKKEEKQLIKKVNPVSYSK